MGSLVSVLNWTCKNCRQINAIENLECSRCQTIRKIIEFDEITDDNQLLLSAVDENEDQINNKSDVIKNDSISNLSTSTTLTQTIKKQSNNKFPGYVEINSDG